MTYFFVLFMLIFTKVWADDHPPNTCQPIAVQEEAVELTTKKPALILIHNLSKNDLWITHPVSDPSASAGWSSRLQAGKWSALSLDKEKFAFTCIESKPGHEQQIPCKEAVAVCKFSNVTNPTQSKGTFWAGEDMSLPSLLTYLGGRGFELPSSKE